MCYKMAIGLSAVRHSELHWLEVPWRISYKLGIIIIVYYAEAAENIKHTHTIHAYTIKQFKHTNKNTYYVKSMR